MRIFFFIITLFTAQLSQAGVSSFGVWSEWTPYSELHLRLPFLKENHARIHLAIREDEISSAEVFKDLVKFMRQAEKEEVEVWLWPLLAKEKGYWFNQWNANPYADYVLALLNRLQTEQITPKGVSMDLEPPPEKMETFLSLIAHKKFKKLVKEARRNVDLKKFQDMQHTVVQLADELHCRGIRTHAVTTPLIFNDPLTVQRIFGIPLVAEAFDFISFMAYRSEYERILGHMNSRLVYRYAARAKSAYGEKAAIDLGVVGNIEFPHPLKGYQKPKRLWQDIAAANAAGITRIQVYALDGMDDQEWLDEHPPKKPLWSLKFKLLDALIYQLTAAID